MKRLNLICVYEFNCIRSWHLYTMHACKNLKKGAVRYAIKSYVFIVRAMLFYKSMFNIWYSTTGIVVRHNTFFYSAYLSNASTIRYLSSREQQLREDNEKHAVIIILDIKHFEFLFYTWIVCTPIINSCCSSGCTCYVSRTDVMGERMEREERKDSIQVSQDII